MDTNIKEGLLVSGVCVAVAAVVGFKFCKDTIGAVKTIRAQAAAAAAAAEPAPADPQQ